jgi:GNAT superfamily N-acetyltransferase
MADVGIPMTIANLLLRTASIAERDTLEALQWRASLMWEEYRDALLAHPDAIELPIDQINEGRVIVAEVEGRTVGFAVVLPRDDGQADLDGLFVEPAIWRKGIGTRLVREAEVHAARRGAQFLHVVAAPHAQAFYSSCGFILTGEEPTRFGVGLTMYKRIGDAL